MPMLIPCIDEIARQKQCDVAFLTFGDLPDVVQKQSKGERLRRYVFGINDWTSHPSRIQIIRLLKTNDIPWRICAGPSNSGFITGGYQGQIYLDVPYDADLPEEQQHPLFKKCLAIIEDGAGQVKWEGVNFYGLTLERAIDMGKSAEKQMKEE